MVKYIYKHVFYYYIYNTLIPTLIDNNVYFKNSKHQLY